MPTTRPRIYLAGPMFSAGDKFEQTELANALTKYEVHLPQRDGIEVASVMDLLNNPALHGSAMLESIVINRIVTWVTRTVVALDVYQSVQGSQCVVLNLDGRVPDEGSLVEATLAWYVGVPVVGYKTTPITELGINNNPMVDALTGWVPLCSTPAEVANAVDAALAKPSTVNAAAIPPKIQSFCRLGETIWQLGQRTSWTPGDVQRAVAEFGALSVDDRNLIESVPLLQPKALEVAVGIIEFSRLTPGDPVQQAIVTRLIADSKAWSSQADVRKAILDNPVTA